jgi:hypothetical protein
VVQYVVRLARLLPPRDADLRDGRGSVRVLSLGAGVQSTTLALMAAHGEIGPMPDCAIFADTQDEGRATYDHLRWLCGVLPFPVHQPTRGKLSEALLAGDDEARIPAFVEGSGLAKRQCTRNFKIRPIRREVRRVLGVGPRSYIAPRTVEQWIGISIDEADRMKPAGVAFMVNRWPLIELRMSRSACAQWLWDRYKRVAPKSSCVDCAFQSDEQWLDRQINAPPDFAEACAIDVALRSDANVARFRGRLFLHRSCRPLGEIDFAALVADRSRQGDLFANECAGVWGVNRGGKDAGGSRQGVSTPE